MFDNSSARILMIVCIGAAILLALLTLSGCGGGTDQEQIGGSCEGGFLTDAGVCYHNAK